MKYQIIYADPPWKYGSRGARSGRYKELPYKTMTIKELCAIPVNEIIDDNAALFMWVTSPFLYDSQEVMKAWGFKYVRVDSVWAKAYESGARRGVVSPWGMTDAEFILMGVKGSMCSNQESKSNQFTVVNAPVEGHSVKPKVFRTRIERRFGSLSKLEMFARREVKGWDCIGNDIDGLDIKDSLQNILKKC